jgi:hypothetical protein
MSFPTETLPEVIRRFCEEGATANRVPVEFFTIPALVAAGSAVGTSRRLEVKRGWTFPANVFAAIVAHTGAGKSPAQAAALAPMEKLQAELARQFEQNWRSFEDELSQWESKDRKERGLKPKPPKMGEILIKDTTVEALVEAHANNPRGLLMVQDELTAWALSLNQYRGGKGADRQHFLSLWAGAPVKVNRKTKHPLIIENPHVSIIGAIPPSVLHQLTDERSEGEDGFIHRILFAYPDLPPGEWTEKVISESTWRSYEDLFHALFKLFADLDGRPEIVKLSPEAKSLWVEKFERTEVEKWHFANTFSPLRGPWAKMPSQAGRIALILHCCKVVLGEAQDFVLDRETMAQAWLLVDYFKDHARRVYRSLTQTPEDRRAEAIMIWVKKRGGEASIRDIYTHEVAGCRSAKEVEQAINRLVEQGVGELVTSKKASGQQTKIFRLIQFVNN